MAQCTAKAKSTGERCRKQATPGVNVCSKHGSKAALMNRGTGSPNYRHGRRSKYLSTKMGERYAEVLKDPELLEYRNEVAILDVLLDDALESINQDAGASMRLWKTATSRLEDFEVALEVGDKDKRREAFIRLRHAIAEGQRDAEARVEARKLIQERTAIAEKENARMLKLENVMTAEQAFTLFSAIMYEAGRIISNGSERAAFNGAMAKLAGDVVA